MLYAHLIRCDMLMQNDVICLLNMMSCVYVILCNMLRYDAHIKGVHKKPNG